MLLGIITTNGLSARTKRKEKTKGKDAFGFCGSAIDLCGDSDTDMTQNLFSFSKMSKKKKIMLVIIGALIPISYPIWGYVLAIVFIISIFGFLILVTKEFFKLPWTSKSKMKLDKDGDKRL